MGLISRVSSRTYRSSKKIHKYNMFRRALQVSVRQMSEAADTGMRFSFASSSSMLYSNATNVTQIDLPTTSGMIGILPHHVPTLGNVAPGWATVMEQGGKVNKYFISSGSFTVNENGTVTVAGEEIVPESEIDLDLARKELAAAQTSLSQAKGEAEKAEAQITIDTLEALLK